MMVSHLEVELREVEERVASLDELCWSVAHDRKMFGDVVTYFELVCTCCGRTVPFYCADDEIAAHQIMNACPCPKQHAA